jgi:hypothetical protein
MRIVAGLGAGAGAENGVCVGDGVVACVDVGIGVGHGACWRGNQAWRSCWTSWWKGARVR